MPTKKQIVCILEGEKNVFRSLEEANKDSDYIKGEVSEDGNTVVIYLDSKEDLKKLNVGLRRRAKLYTLCPLTLKN